MPFEINLGGEGEIPGLINQQPEWVIEPLHWATVGTKLTPLILAGEPFLFCQNIALPFPNDSVDRVFTNNVRIDGSTWLGPSVQSSEIERVLKRKGDWYHDQIRVFTKP